ncbi:hypothetical protein ACP4OV_020970 [Aristida adscensionis]
MDDRGGKGKANPDPESVASVLVAPDPNATYTHAPSINQSLIPPVGMTFDNEQLGIDFFNEYANKAGFGTRLGNLKKQSRVVHCCLEGKGEFYKPGKQRVRKKYSKRTGCRVKIKFKRDPKNLVNKGAVFIETLNLLHNHPLLPHPGVTKQMRSHKAKDGVLPEFIDNVQEGNVPHHNIPCVMVMQGDYADFGDVMCFDTTHRTNLYDKPFGMFVGANNHLQNTLFACALVGDETIPTFQWVFNSFKKCMGTIKTKCILTDQDSAMVATLQLEFPDTSHHNCLSELYIKYDEEGFREKFDAVLNHPLTPLEFETAWDELITEFGLHEHPTMMALYHQRKNFIPAYFKHDYCGRMTSTQRSECTNFIMKNGFVTPSTPLHRFAKETFYFLQRRKDAESTAIYAGTSQVDEVGKWMFELQMSRVYTRAVFNEFEHTVSDCTAYRVDPDLDLGPHHFLVKYNTLKSKISWAQRRFKVYANADEGRFSCECKNFEHIGLLCVHILRTFIHLQVEKIPEQYVLKRYTRFAHGELPFDRSDQLLVGSDGDTQSCRTKMLLTKAMPVVCAGSMSNAAYIKAIDALCAVFHDIESIPPDIGPNAESSIRTDHTNPLNMTSADPIVPCARLNVSHSCMSAQDCTLNT